MNNIDMERFRFEEMLRYRDITDDADAIADIVIQLSIYYKDPDIDKFLDMPASRAPLLVKEIARHEKELARKTREAMRR